MFLTSLNVKLENFEEECIKSIDSIFDAYFLLSKENLILDYGIKDKCLNLYFGKENLQGEDLINLLRSQIHQERKKELIQKILEKKPQIFEISLTVKDLIGYYDIFIFNLVNDQMLISFRNIDKQKNIEFELAEERNILKNIIELNPYAIQIKDVEGRHVSHNKAFIDMFGSFPTPEYSIFEDPHLKKRGLLDKILTLKEGKILRLGEHWYDVRDSAIEGGYNVDDYPSKPLCNKVVAFPIFDKEGKIKNYIIMHEDITKQKKIEQKLKESEEKFRDLANLLPQVVFETDERGNIKFFNNNAYGVFGYTPDDLNKGLNALQLIIPEDRERVLENIKRILSRKKVEKIGNNEFIALKKDGSTFPVLIYSNPIIHKGKFVGLRSIIIDITEQKNAEQKLKESEEMYRNLFNTTPYAIWLVDLQGKILDCNETMDKFLAIFKYTDLIGKPFREVLKMFAREGDPRFENIEKVLKERFKILLKKGYLKPIEFEVYRGDGKTFWITLESSFVKIDKKSLIQTFIKDITEKKLAEIELEGLRKDLETRVKERTIKLENSEKKYRKAYNRADCYKGLFTHDISNIFQIIGNSIELSQMQLEESINKKELLECFEVIAQQIKRGKSLINNIRNLSEIEESEMPLKSTEIFEKLRSAIQFVRINFQKREININIRSDVDALYVLANDLLLDVFENILINAVRYNKDEAVEIVIDISRVIDKEKAYIRLQFKDNGIGINDNKKKLIFDKNYKKKIGSKGMGLGLSLVAKLLDLCKGKIWVEDRIKGNYTKGSNFIIQIPEAT